MYGLNDTIAAVSSAGSQDRVIIRISGPETINTVNRIFAPTISAGRRTKDDRRPSDTLRAMQGRQTRLISGKVTIDRELEIDALLYLFPAPNSYTGEDVAELHLFTNAAVTEALMSRLFEAGLRMPGPGEFTARAYLAGKMDLSQAEAVNEIIISSNTFQLAAAEKLLSGKLAETTANMQAQLLDCLSLIEAGLDFSGEDIEFISQAEAAERLAGIKTELEKLLAGSIRNETFIDLPAVGIAGAPNAGKSQLLNKLLGEERSIVSNKHKTTRDVLTGLLTLEHCRCVLFDCAGLLATTDNILDELAQQAAIEALRNSSIVVLCVDISKDDWSEDASILAIISGNWLNGNWLNLPHTDESPATNNRLPTVIPVATKSDLLSKETLANRLAELNSLFNADFLPTSAVTGAGLEQLQNTIDKKLIGLSLGTGSEELSERASGVALTARHRQAVTAAIENVRESISELKAGNDEVTAMMLRAAYQNICDIEQQHVDEEILDRIFSRFCIGK